MAISDCGTSCSLLQCEISKSRCVLVTTSYQNCLIVPYFYAKSILKSNLKLRSKKLRHDHLLNPNPKPISDLRPIPILQTGGVGSSFYAIAESWDTHPVGPNKSKRFRVFLTLCQMIYLTCIHSQTSWSRHCEIITWNLQHRHYLPFAFQINTFKGHSPNSIL